MGTDSPEFDPKDPNHYLDLIDLSIQKKLLREKIEVLDLAMIEIIKHLLEGGVDRKTILSHIEHDTELLNKAYK